MPNDLGPHQERVNPRSAETQRHRSTAPRGSDEAAVRFYLSVPETPEPPEPPECASASAVSGLRVEREREEREHTSLRKRNPPALSRHHTLLRDQNAAEKCRPLADQHRRLTDVTAAATDARNLILDWPLLCTPHVTCTISFRHFRCSQQLSVAPFHVRHSA